MPLPKSFTSLLTAIVVAIPAAITTLALNKPKPPKEIDAVIQLDENDEVIAENEIEPEPEPKKPPEIPSGSAVSASGSVPLGGARSSDGSDSQESSSGADSSDSSPEEPPSDSESEIEDEEDTDQSTEENQNQEDKEEEEKEDNPEPPPSPDQQGDKDMTKEELQQSLIEVIKKIIEEGKGFNQENNGLYKLYIINSSLSSLKDYISALQAKIQEEEKSKAATEVSGVPGSPSGNGGQSK